MKKCVLGFLFGLCFLMPIWANEPNKVREPNTTVAYFDEDKRLQSVPNSKGIYRVLKEKYPDGSFLVQDFYQDSDKSYTDPFIITDEKNLDSMRLVFIRGGYQTYHPNGQPKSKGQFVAPNAQNAHFVIEGGVSQLGRREDIWIEWYPNGQKALEGNYDEKGNQTGIWRTWHENGKPRTVKSFKNKQQDGTWTEWYSNGQQKSISHFDAIVIPDYRLTIYPTEDQEDYYLSGLQKGLWTTWYENGQKSEEGAYVYDSKPHRNYSDGSTVEDSPRPEKNGVWTTWYENGQKKSETHFILGVEKGLITQWYENGQKQAEGQKKSDFREIGLWTQWYENGQKQAQGEYAVTEPDDSGNDKSGKHGQWHEWFENGHLKAEGAYDFGLRTGEWRYWHPNGILKMQGQWKADSSNNDRRDYEFSRWIYWSDKGIKQAEGKYGYLGLAEGVWIYFHDNGQKKAQGHLVHSYAENWAIYNIGCSSFTYKIKSCDSHDGVWTYWYDNGQKQARGVEKNGKKMGKWQYWDLNGKPQSKSIINELFGTENGVF